MSEFKSLQAALEGHFDKVLTDLPPGVRKRIERDLSLYTGTTTPPPIPDPHPAAVSGNVWDQLTPAQRRYAAAEWDAGHDPALEEERERSWGVVVKVHELRDRISYWETRLDRTATDAAVREDRLADLHKELAEAEAELKKLCADGPSNEHPVHIRGSGESVLPTTAPPANRRSDSRGHGLHRRIREWREAKYPRGTAKPQAQLAAECAQDLELRSLDVRTYRRAFGGK